MLFFILFYHKQSMILPVKVPWQDYVITYGK